MRIREFDYTTQDYDAVVHIANTVWPERAITTDQLRNEDQDYKPPYVRRRFLAVKDEQVVACCSFEHRPGMYHPQRFWLSIQVLPAHRQQGIGTSLYQHLLATLKSDHAAHELHTSISDTHTPGMHFLLHRGFQEMKRSVETHLDTATFDATPFQELDQQLATSGIQIHILSDLLLSDADALHNVYELHQALVQDVPSPAQRTKIDFDSWKWGYSSAYPNFIPQANFIALHHGAYIGLSGLWGDLSSGQLNNGMTGVMQAYRRKGVATALKVRGIIFAQAHGNLRLITFNKSENPMLELNLKLGFRPHDTEIMYMKKLSPEV